ncbi:ion transporter [Rhodohalobacter barkolensis]|uniref:Ion transporter n=1 Tax=Rhodohalobacter barkolensis TaxID=2053187 RepID=A0A2N0VKH5_9BACT|nr:ion transporter [Rhodohalobacter barkolensis]PKD44678.1 ion transporter [Rhodohalobacter barkolensis]
MEAGNQLSFKERLNKIIFEADTPSGKAFDIILIVSIVISVLVVMLDSVSSYRAVYGDWFFKIEWVITILFTFEYILRLTTAERSRGYIFSFYGFVDLLSFLPTYLSLLIPGTQFFLVIRILRVLRVFRVLKFTRYIVEADQLRNALASSRRKIIIFVYTVITITVIVGSLMHVIEGPENGFTSIPRGIYWAIVTLTTVGYGDISPQTNLGQMVSAIIMILGYGIIAIPTGIFTAEFSRVNRDKQTTKTCPHCSKEGHDSDAEYCKYCGGKLNPE